MPNKIRQILLEQLCDHFRFEYDEILPIQAQQMLYIHDWIVRNHDKIFLKDVLYEIDLLHVPIKTRGKRRRLGELYWQLKTTSIIESARYDTTTLKPPTKTFKFDDY